MKLNRWLGLAALTASAILFAFVRYAGAAYLVYLGVRMILGSRGTPSAQAEPTRTAPGFMQGFVTHLSNPKAVLYWTALLPQFITPGRPAGVLGHLSSSRYGPTQGPPHA